MPKQPPDNGSAGPARLGYTVAGTAAAALLGCFLAREGWAPRPIASVLVAIATHQSRGHRTCSRARVHRGHAGRDKLAAQTAAPIELVLEQNEPEL